MIRTDNVWPQQKDVLLRLVMGGGPGYLSASVAIRALWNLLILALGLGGGRCCALASILCSGHDGLLVCHQRCKYSGRFPPNGVVIDVADAGLCLVVEIRGFRMTRKCDFDMWVLSTWKDREFDAP
jgi:hypothetical protein